MKMLRGTGHADAHKSDTDLPNYLVDGEAVEVAFKMGSGYLAVTNRRLILMAKSGMTASTKEYQSIPYGRIGSFTATGKGSFSMGGSSELRIRVQGLTDEVVMTFSDNDSFIAVQRGLAAIVCPVM